MKTKIKKEKKSHLAIEKTNGKNLNSMSQKNDQRQDEIIQQFCFVNGKILISY